MTSQTSQSAKSSWMKPISGEHHEDTAATVSPRSDKFHGQKAGLVATLSLTVGISHGHEKVITNFTMTGDNNSRRRSEL